MSTYKLSEVTVFYYVVWFMINTLGLWNKVNMFFFKATRLNP